MGDFVSKLDAAAWAETALEAEWTPLIQQALAWQHDEQEDDEALHATLQFIRHAIDRKRNCLGGQIG